MKKKWTKEGVPYYFSTDQGLDKLALSIINFMKMADITPTMTMGERLWGAAYEYVKYNLDDQRQMVFSRPTLLDPTETEMDRVLHWCEEAINAILKSINKAIDEGNDILFCASTGNAASSLAMLNANTDMKTYIFVPAAIPDGKRAQLEISGAEVYAVEGTYDEVYDLSLDLGLEKGWYCRHAAINPYLLEGKKTGAFEIIIQNDFEVPDYVFIGVGDGTVVSSLYKGFWEFKEIGLTDKIPKIIGVQAEGIPAIKEAFEKGKPYKPIAIDGTTVADSISVGKPRDVIKACTYVEASGGYFISLNDDEILEAIKELGKTGIFAEPAGAVPYGGLKKLIYENRISKSDTVCLVITGNGLKDVKAVEGAISKTTFTAEEVIKRFEE